jgi:hypothetical protein
MKKKQTLKTEVEKTVRLLITTLGVIIVVLVVAFLVTTSQSAQQGYRLEQARIQNEDLKNASEGLKAKVTDAAASSNFEESNKLNDMGEAPEMNYLLPEDND